ncbi:DNA cytosine methyltransferase [Nonomuraea sp. NPDC050547]|uniref:DNA cytosine methyltransferase n=1 Tax=Nonomuraea sp. NPDC050547 TaxID=3364368 RepID=UPI00378875C7
MIHDSSTITLSDWFCGAGGSSQGAHKVPGVEIVLAANHWKLAISSHRANFPNTRHEDGDIREAPVFNWPVTMIHWASTECTKWTIANGKKQHYKTSRQEGLFSRPMTPQEEEEEFLAEQSRALTKQVADYLEGCHARARTPHDIPLVGVMENVLDEYDWDGFPDFRQRLHRLGYKTAVFGLNSMHLRPVRTLGAPQSRDRLYLVYWHTSLGRTPDFAKWLRPKAYCDTCDKVVLAMAVYKNPKREAGKYRSQYIYRCPSTRCRNQIVNPEVLPALAAIDLSLPTRRIGDGKPGKEFRPYAPNTVARVTAGMRKHWLEPLLVPTGGTWRTEATPVSAPMPTRTTTENDGLAIPPLLIPAEGREGKHAAPATQPMRTQTARRETAVAFPPPFLTLLRSGRPRNTDPSVDPLATIVADGSNHAVVEPPPLVIPMRGGGDKEKARLASDPLHTITAGGNHHYLAQAPEPLLIPYTRTGVARPTSSPFGTFTTHDRFGLAALDLDEAREQVAAIDVNDVRFRMLEPDEIARGMAFDDGYIVLGDKRAKVRQYGNAVTPNAAEVLISALVECLTGEELPRELGDVTV